MAPSAATSPVVSGADPDQGLGIEDDQGAGDTVEGVEAVVSDQPAGEPKAVCVRTVPNWIADGDVKARRIGPRLIRIPAAELDVVADMGGAA